MKHYRIVRKSKKYVSVSNYDGIQKPKVVEKIWYVAEERFLWIFWFGIGHKVEDYMICQSTISHKTSTRQEMEEYLQVWHEVNYGKREYVIDYKL